MNLLKLSASYLRQRPFSTSLNVLILALGIATIVVLLLVSDRVEQNLTRNAEGIDLVVGAKGSPLQLILSSVYHIDAPTGNISVAEAEALMENRAVAEAMPLALGDSYRGFRIVGATQAYADHYGGEVARGRFWSGTMEATLGAVAAREVGLDVGDVFYSAHGLGAGGEAHDEHPIKVVGVLAETGTVLDRLLLTSIETVWDVHGAHGHDDDHGDEHEGHHTDEDAGHDHGHDEDHAHADDHAHDADHQRAESEENHAVSARTDEGDGSPDGAPDATLSASGPPGLAGQTSTAPAREYTAVLIRYASPLAAASFPRYVNTQTDLQAAAPAFQTARLFNLLGVGFDAVRAFGLVLVLVAVLSVFVALLSALKDRRYDLAMMRTLGASRRKLMAHVLLEGLILAGMGTLLGLVLGHVAAAILGGAVEQAQGMALGGFTVVTGEIIVVLLALAAGIVAALLPAYQAYRTDIARVLAKG
ncbi:ABC transporter permease [Longibacter sp.]|uniref:ABC transporter permease n=1 Tax=Longibacter sp. TaxID=2045415 RepID=UPI003EBC09D1